MSATLYLLPSSLGADQPNLFPPQLFEVVDSVDFIIAEKAKTTRRFLRAIGFKKPFDSYRFETLNKRTSLDEILSFVQDIQKHGSAAYVSEAGSPCVADPGSLLVRLCHDMGVLVKPVPGPSSILLALAASGLNGQEFAFTGYLPIAKKERLRAIRRLEQKSKQTGEAILFMETPYRNNALFKALINSLKDDTFLGLACDITTPNEWIRTFTVGRWKHQKVEDLHKRPCMYIIQA